MGQMAQKISQVDQEELLTTLNMAYAEEWLAYYQYWIGSKVAIGPMRPKIADEFLEHAKEELSHAEKLAARIIELGGTPLIDPKEWQEKAACKYDAPTNPYIMNLLEQNIVAERCAIARYQKICEMTFGKDFVTFNMALEILHDEIEHEEELGAYKADITATFEHKNVSK